MEKYSDIEWGKIIGLRNLLIHEYFGEDTKIVWDIIQEDLPVLKDEINFILEELETG